MQLCLWAGGVQKMPRIQAEAVGDGRDGVDGHLAPQGCATSCPLCDLFG